jgi:GT2 family glycosyltransferase
MMSDVPSNLGLVVPVFNALDCVVRLLDGLENSEAADLPIVFVNDASTEDVRTPILEYCSRHNNAQYLYNPIQQLFTRTVNRGIRAHTPFIEFFVLLNTDCELREGWLNRMIECMQKDPSIAIVGYPDGIPVEGPDQEARYPSRHGSPDYITGHCMLVPRWAFEEFGMFVETDRNQAHIGSERIWCWQINQRGYKMMYVNSPLVIHNQGGPSWKRDLTWLFKKLQQDDLWDGKDEL